VATSPKRPRKPVKKGSTDQGYGKKRFPPRKKNHRISDAVARNMRLRYLKKYGNRSTALTAGAYSRDIFDKILAQPQCVGVRFYPGLDTGGRLTLLFCGVDNRGDDILAGIIGDTPWRCPPLCSSANDTLQF
jgi:hypothetical protein